MYVVYTELDNRCTQHWAHRKEIKVSATNLKYEMKLCRSMLKFERGNDVKDGYDFGYIYCAMHTSSYLHHASARTTTRKKNLDMDMANGKN